MNYLEKCAVFVHLFFCVLVRVAVRMRHCYRYCQHCDHHSKWIHGKDLLAQVIIFFSFFFLNKKHGKKQKTSEKTNAKTKVEANKSRSSFS